MQIPDAARWRGSCAVQHNALLPHKLRGNTGSLGLSGGHFEATTSRQVVVEGHLTDDVTILHQRLYHNTKQVLWLFRVIAHHNNAEESVIYDTIEMLRPSLSK